MILAFDYSWARPSPASMAEFGVRYVCRYLYSEGKGVTRDEVDALHAAGIGVVLNFEAAAGNVLGGRAQGVADGRAAFLYAQQLGAPLGLPIYFSADVDVTSDQMPTVLEYYRGAQTVLGDAYQVRAYGEASVIDAVAAAGIARYGWQTIAWSNGYTSPRAAIFQFAINKDFLGSAVDHNRVMDEANLGAWMPPGAVNAAAQGAKDAIKQEDDVKIVENRDNPKNAALVVGDDVQVVSPGVRAAYLEAGTPIAKVSNDSYLRFRARVKVAVDDDGDLDAADILAAIKNLPAQTVAAIKAAL